MNVQKRVELNVVIQHSIQQLSTSKYFYNDDKTLSILDSHLDYRGILLTQKERKWLLKRFNRTLERLGFANHRGGVQTVEILRSH